MRNVEFKSARINDIHGLTFVVFSASTSIGKIGELTRLQPICPKGHRLRGPRGPVIEPKPAIQGPVGLASCMQNSWYRVQLASLVTLG